MALVSGGSSRETQAPRAMATRAPAMYTSFRLYDTVMLAGGKGNHQPFYAQGKEVPQATPHILVVRFNTCLRAVATGHTRADELLLSGEIELDSHSLNSSLRPGPARSAIRRANLATERCLGGCAGAETCAASVPERCAITTGLWGIQLKCWSRRCGITKKVGRLNGSPAQLARVVPSSSRRR